MTRWNSVMLSAKPTLMLRYKTLPMKMPLTLRAILGHDKIVEVDELIGGGERRPMKVRRNHAAALELAGDGGTVMGKALAVAVHARAVADARERYHVVDVGHCGRERRRRSTDGLTGLRRRGVHVSGRAIGHELPAVAIRAARIDDRAEHVGLVSRQRRGVVVVHYLRVAGCEVAEAELHLEGSHDVGAHPRLSHDVEVAHPDEVARHHHAVVRARRAGGDSGYAIRHRWIG